MSELSEPEETNRNVYYTYAYLRTDGTPYYIGKGKGRRMFYGRNRAVKTPEDSNRIIVLKSGLSEQQAFSHEKYMIFILGRKDIGTGILRNRTNGEMELLAEFYLKRV